MRFFSDMPGIKTENLFKYLTISGSGVHSFESKVKILKKFWELKGNIT